VGSAEARSAGSPAASFINGASLTMDGGWTAR